MKRYRLSLRTRLALYTTSVLMMLCLIFAGLLAIFSHSTPILPNMLFSFAFTVIAGMVSSYWVSGLALRPVREMSEAVAGIDSRTLHTRLRLEEWEEELRDLGLSFNSMLDRLEAAFRQQSRFISDASHELRTPLAILRTQLDVLVLSPDDPADREDFRLAADRMLSRLESLVEDLLLLSDGRYAPGDDETFDLRQLLHDIIVEIKPISRTLGVSIRLEVLLQQPMDNVVGSRHLWFHVFHNVIENAVRYNRQGGEVNILITSEAENLVVLVNDTGIGIRAHQRDLIFERFYRVESSRNRNQGGSGLGLSIARHLTEMMGGQLELEHTDENGSRFKITLTSFARPERI
ncbi:sensor histidine kinase [Paenibacillus hexagrammi]|uniref:histidine kinase n=1 Tax=Paenibacillus hexagrammi TaxID=2908839 RepID=A0ABY3SNY2_9BACL|nr:ATP-binding protein [Paenibacillus sp. YPD9-1]UJF35643.1 ATP-binding protein [Paenibacillus sp. YPD9-1]